MLSQLPRDKQFLVINSLHMWKAHNPSAFVQCALLKMLGVERTEYGKLKDDGAKARLLQEAQAAKYDNNNDSLYLNLYQTTVPDSITV